MSANDADIRVRIAGDLADIRRSLQQLQKDTRAAGKQARDSERDWSHLGRGLDSIRSRITGLVGAYLSFAGARAVVRQIEESAKALEEVNRQARALGASSESIQELNFTFRQFNLDTNDVSDALGTLADRARDAESGTASFIEDFKLLGVEVDDLRGKRPEQLFALVARRVADIQDPTRRTAGIVRIFGDDLGRRLSPLLLEGEEGLRRYADAAREAGAVLDDELVQAGAETAQVIRDLRVEIGSRATQVVAEYADQIKFLADVIASAAEGTFNFLENTRELFGGLRNETLSQLRQELQQMENLLEGGFFSRTGVFNLGGEIEFHLSDEELRAEIARVRAEIERLEAEQAAAAANRPQGDTPTTPPSQAIAIRRLQSDLAAAGVLLQDELKRLGAALDRDFEDNLVRFADYYRRRAELETRAIDQQLETQRAALALIDDEIRLARARGDAVTEQETKRAKLVAEITALERQRGDVATKAARDQLIAERDLADQLAGVRQRLLELQGDAAGARSEALALEFRELLERLAIEGDEEGQALVQRLINVELARTRLGELQADYERTLSALARAERRVELQVETGLISEREGRRQIVELHERTADEVEQLIPLMEELARATGDPAALERLEELKLEVEELRSTAETVGKEMREALQDAGSDAFSSFIDGSKRAKDAWRDFVDDVRQRLADFIADQAFERLFQFLGGGGGNVGGDAAGGGIRNFFASIFHEGGIAGLAREFRRVPALSFARAPRLHDGGVAGLRPGELPAILQRGEEVLSRRDPRHQANGGMMVGDINIYTRDAESFRRQSRGQLGAQIANEMIRARNRNS